MTSIIERSRRDALPAVLAAIGALLASIGPGCATSGAGVESTSGPSVGSPDGERAGEAQPVGLVEGSGLAPAVAPAVAQEGEEKEKPNGSDAEAPKEASAELPTMDGLLGLLRRLDGPGMEAAFEVCLLQPGPGFKILHDFLSKCDVERDKILTLTHDPLLVFGLLRLVARRPDEVAAFSDYLMTATRDRTNSFIRREIYNFLPVFLNYHRGKYLSVRRNLEKDIVYQLEQGGDYLYKVRIAIRELDFVPPSTAFFACLEDPARTADHQAAVAATVALGEKGLEAVLAYVDESAEHAAKPGPVRSAISHAVRQVILSQKDQPDSKFTKRLLGHVDENVRGIAILTFFRLPKEDRTAQAELGEEQVLDFLNGGAAGTFKQTLIAVVSRSSPETIFALEKRAEEIREEKTRQRVIDRAERLRKRSSKKTR